MDFPQPAVYPSVVVVNITTACNLRCKYCFADCEPSQQREDMTEDVMLAIIREMLVLPESEIITFEFQGGEPTLNIVGIERFISIAEQLKTSSNKTVKYRIESNGTVITDELITLLKKYNMEIGISIDGPMDMTNNARVYEDGTGAFTDIENGIKKLHENGIKVAGSVCTIGKHNASEPIKIVDFFNQIDIGFKPRPANIFGREIVSNTTTKPGEWANVFKTMYRPSKQGNVENFSIHIFEENVYTPIRDYICLRYPCGAAREIISVNPDGTVYPCDGFKGAESFSMGNILNEPIAKMLEKIGLLKCVIVHGNISQNVASVYSAECVALVVILLTVPMVLFGRKTLIVSIVKEFSFS
ncbi:radical SAM family protein [Beggiatoa sp. PS]|nr:radical SAM family protein [Beggiatoa sp. PS]